MDSWIRNQEEVFGRGLNLGQQREQERIVKLLEGFDDSCLWKQVEWSPDAYEGFNMQDLISVIKGENK